MVPGTIRNASSCRIQAFYDGYTAVEALTHFDVNGDGFEDLLLVHERNHATLLNVTHTGRYIQILINDGTAAGVLRRRRAMSFVGRNRMKSTALAIWRGSARGRLGACLLASHEVAHVREAGSKAAHKGR